MHFVFVALADTQQAVQAPAVFTATFNVGGDPFLGVVGVGFLVVGSQARVGTHSVMGSANFAHQFIARLPLQYIDLPGLGVYAGWCATGDIEHMHQRLTRYGLRQKSTHRHAAGDGLVYRVHKESFFKI